MSGVEEYVRRARRKPWDDRPLTLSMDRSGSPRVGADVPCGCGGDHAGIHWAPHRDNPAHYIVKYSSRCGLRLWEAAELAGMTKAQLESGNEGLLARYAEELSPPEIDPSDVERWHEALCADRALMRFVNEERLISDAVVRHRRIGHDGERYVIPVWKGGKLVNLRRYHPNPEDPSKKILSLRNGGAQIYPDVPAWPLAVRVEGEWDALAAESLGFPTFTTTGGAMCWRDEWSSRFTGKTVFVIGDKDDAGVAGAEKVRRSLIAAGVEAVNVALPLSLPYRRTKGPDVTDFLRAGGDLRTLLNTAWLRERREPRPNPRPRLSPITATGRPLQNRRIARG